MPLSSGQGEGVDDRLRGERHRSPPEGLRGRRAGDAVGRGIDADDHRPTLAHGPLSGDDAVAGATDDGALDERAAQRGHVVREVRAAADQGVDLLRRGIDGARRAVGQEVVRQAAERRGARRAAEDHQPTAEAQPGAQRGQLLGLELGRVDVLPDQAVDGRPRLHASGQVLRCQGDDRRRRDPGIGQRAVQGGHERAGLFGHHADDRLILIVSRDRHVGLGDRSPVGDERDAEVAAEDGGLGVEHVALA